ncbi:hypothetical protein F4810DRAFT_667332 [Camillea tinctor]|nr:hypothetical protein F4810DRAFT_667332 [Camillea tinctor]
MSQVHGLNLVSSGCILFFLSYRVKKVCRSVGYIGISTMMSRVLLVLFVSAD